MTRNSTTVDRPTPGRIDSTWLPPAFVGESCSAQPAPHEWPGNLFLWLSWLTAAGLGIFAFVAIPSGLLTLDPRFMGMGVMAGVGYLLQRRLAKGVQHFTRWGWYGVMAQVGAVTAAKLWALATGSASGIGIGLLLDVVWLRYF